MKNTRLNIDHKVMGDILLNLLQDSKKEYASFIFANPLETAVAIDFNFKSWYKLGPEDYSEHSRYILKLSDNIRPKIIKRAFDLKCSIIEIHTHIGDNPAGFSLADFIGFSEFVPHVRWRLNNRPYAAIVFSKRDFDGIVWAGDSKEPFQLAEIKTEKLILRTNGLTLKYKDKINV